MKKTVLGENTRNISLHKKKKGKSSSSEENGKPKIINIHDLGEENNELMLTLQGTTSPMLDWSERRKDYRYYDESPSPTSDGEGSSFHQQRSEQKINSAKNSPVRQIKPKQKTVKSFDFNINVDDDGRPKASRVGTNFRLRPRQIVYINDYDFRTHRIEVQEGTIVDFRLLDVPNHAEHQLEGKSSIECLRFLSPVLQKGDEESYEFIARSTGEVVVSCTLNTDMKCKIIVKESKSLETQSTTPLLDTFASMMPRRSEEPITISGVGRVVYGGSGYNSCNESYSSGISDSDDENMRVQSDHGNSISSCTQGGISLRNSLSSVKQIYVEQFAFRPSHLVIPRNTSVEFVPIAGAHATLDCDSTEEGMNLFHDIDIDAAVDKNFVCKFENLGTVTVKNAIYTFMTCDITVIEQEEEISIDDHDRGCMHEELGEEAGCSDDSKEEEDNPSERLKMSTSQRRKERRKKAQQKQLKTDNSVIHQLETVDTSVKKRKKKSKSKNRGDPPTYLEAISAGNNYGSDSEDRREESLRSEDGGKFDDLCEEGPAVDEHEEDANEISHDELEDDINKDFVDVVGSPPDYESVFNNSESKNSNDSANIVNVNLVISSVATSPQDIDVGSGWCVAEKSRKGKIKIRRMGHQRPCDNVHINGETDEERDLRLAIEESKKLYALERKTQHVDTNNSSFFENPVHTESDIVDPETHQDQQQATIDDQTDDESIECCFINNDYDDEIDKQNVKPSDKSPSCHETTRISVKLEEKTSPTKEEDISSTPPATGIRGKQCLLKKSREDKTEVIAVKGVRYNEFELLLLEKWKTIEPHRGIDILPETSMGKRKADICVIGSN